MPRGAKFAGDGDVVEHIPTTSDWCSGTSCGSGGPSRGSFAFSLFGRLRRPLLVPCIAASLWRIWGGWWSTDTRLRWPQGLVGRWFAATRRSLPCLDGTTFLRDRLTRVAQPTHQYPPLCGAACTWHSKGVLPRLRLDGLRRHPRCGSDVQACVCGYLRQEWGAGRCGRSTHSCVSVSRLRQTALAITSSPCSCGAGQKLRVRVLAPALDDHT